jgi:hypothetical protein
MVKHKGLICQISPLMTAIDELGLVCKYSRLYIKVSATGAQKEIQMKDKQIQNLIGYRVTWMNHRKQEILVE